MRFLGVSILSLLFLASGQAAVASECEAKEGEECYSEEVWASPAMLEDMAKKINGGVCGELDASGWSEPSGATFESRCEEGQVKVVQVFPEHVLKTRPLVRLPPVRDLSGQ